MAIVLSSTPCVVIAIDPFMLRSAVEAVFARDARVQSHLVAREDDAVECARVLGADAVVVSRPVDAPDLLVVRVRDQFAGVEVSRGASRRVVPYTGVRGLVELVLAWLATWPSGSERPAAAPPVHEE